MDEQIYVQLNHLNNLIQLIFTQYFSTTPRSQGILLRILNKHGTLPQKSLAACLQISHAALSELVTKLEARKLVKRLVSKSDRRLSMVELTGKGRLEAEKLTSIAQNAMDTLFQACSDEEKELFSKLCSKIIFSLDDGKTRSTHDFCEECGLCTQSYSRST
jgi:DNA-binding MarR family transcriptional regulator